MTNEVANEFTLRPDFKSDIINSRLSNFLNKYGVEYNYIQSDMFRALEDGVNNGYIPEEEANHFLYRETKYGENRTIFYYEIFNDDLDEFREYEANDMEERLKKKGWKVPEKNLLEYYHPEELMVTECKVEKGRKIELTFTETVSTLHKSKQQTTVKRENNYYFVTIDLEHNEYSLRMRPRYTIVQPPDENPIPYTVFFHYITRAVQDIFGIEFITTVDFKETLYRIARDMTERAEKKWREKVNKHKTEIEEFAQSMESKLDEIDKNEFDLEFRLKRLLERALIQSNFDEMTKDEPGKKGYVSMFHFSDGSGGKIKASSKEKETAIELSEIYYDTRDTIDKSKEYDILWVYWFVGDEEIKTRLEVTSEYYQIHFYKYITKEGFENVLSKIRGYKNS
ncbi:hypothetical protein SAMN05192559_10485 [Halobacillus karajensis]|uniref:hypothetical protein n=1 Tax=Halobacillus karajensis TaxID=195088 RepID=UPI0008A78228|nr:hypothetical protein [Halobacillus karajensis]SEH78188.1 hypothetical protein SAMN05192559_10485 [Halobacillus karajensis]